ncbi:MAG: PP2C family protein-serine/threonine phosphatase [Nocardioides sp.]
MKTQPAPLAAASATLGAGWDAAPVAAVAVAADGRVLDINRAARAVLPAVEPGDQLSVGAPGWLSAADSVVRSGGPVGDVAGVAGSQSFDAHPVAAADGSVMWWLEETTRLRASQEALRLERESTAFLHAASDALLSSLNASRTMEVAAELAVSRLADAAWVIAPVARGVHQAVQCLHGERPRALTLRIRAEDIPGLAEALQGFPPVPSRWIDPAGLEPWIVPDGFGEAGPMVVTSLPGHGVPAGALVLLRRADRVAFSEDEEAVARLFASRVGAALAAARLFEQQSAITDVLTSQLLPPALRRSRGIDFAGVYRPAQETARLGGDFYDVHETEDGGTLALLGDVCGQGLEAAVLTGKIRNTMQALLPLAGDHGRVLTLLNAALIGAGETRFASLVLASALREDDGLRLRLTRAGHLPPLVVRADGRVEEILGRGPVVGVLDEPEFETLEVRLEPGETCLLYTDGVVEARGGPMGGELFGEERLHLLLSECGGLPAEAVVERVVMLATQWLEGPEHDDIAVLAITAPRVWS